MGPSHLTYKELYKHLQSEISAGSMKFKLKRVQKSKIPREKILDALENVAKLNNFKYFTGEKFEAEGVFSRHTVIREFGSWKKAIEELKKYLSSKKIEFNAKPNNFGTTELRNYSI